MIGLIIASHGDFSAINCCFALQSLSDLTSHLMLLRYLLIMKPPGKSTITFHSFYCYINRVCMWTLPCSASSSIYMLPI